jgi:hypothetical protein
MFTARLGGASFRKTCFSAESISECVCVQSIYIFSYLYYHIIAPSIAGFHRYTQLAYTAHYKKRIIRTTTYICNVICWFFFFFFFFISMGIVGYWVKIWKRVWRGMLMIPRTPRCESCLVNCPLLRTKCEIHKILKWDSRYTHHQQQRVIQLCYSYPYLFVALFYCGWLSSNYKNRAYVLF